MTSPSPLIDDLLRYSRLWGPAGEEDRVIAAFVADLTAHGLTPAVDRLGNVSATLCEAQPGYPTVMVSAHLDEIGFVVRKIETDGFLRLHRVGGTHDRVVAGQAVVFQGERGPVEGVIGVKAKHVSTPQELASSVSVDDAYVDILVASRDEALALGIEVGTLGTFRAEPLLVRDHVVGKALDDRAAVAILLEVVRRLAKDPPRAGVAIVGTVQEEFAVRAGVVAARRVAPDLAVCIDIAIATDTPDLGYLGDVRLGAGPVVSRFTRANLNGIIPNPKLRRLVGRVAAEQGIPLQNGVLQGGLTDGSYMQYEGEGIPTIDVGFAVRYTHTPIETAHLRDVEQTADLLIAVLRDLPSGIDLARGTVTD